MEQESATKSRWQFDLRSLLMTTLKIAIVLALFRYGTILPYYAELKRKKNTVEFFFADGSGTSTRLDSDGNAIGSIRHAEAGRSIKTTKPGDWLYVNGKLRQVVKVQVGR